MENVIMKKTCRTCAKSFSKKLSPLFGEENLFLMRYIYRKKYYVKMEKNDGLPQRICSECLQELLRLTNFLIKCEESEQLLIKKIKEAKILRSTLETKIIDDFKSEYNSDDENIKSYYNLENQANSSKDMKTTEFIIEKLNPLEVEFKIENDIIDEKSFLNKNNETKNKITAFESQDFAEDSSDMCYENIDFAKENTRSNFKKSIKNQKRNDYKCAVCNENFKNITDFKLHKKLHQESKKIERKIFLCDLCGKEFSKPDSLRDHTNIHLGIKPYKCEICEKTFSLRNALRSHVAKHSRTETYPCEICGKVFTNKSYYRLHLRRHEKGLLSEKPFKCPHCPKSFKLLSTLTAHCNFHNKTLDRKYHCTECNTTFKRSDHLKEHINGVHLKILPFKCDICPKLFVTGAIRNAHVKRFHSGVRHKCDLCEKDFSLAASLSRHKRTHNGDKRFICEICNMSFMAVYQIEKHMESHKIDETTKNNLILQTYEEITKTVMNINKK